MSETEVSVGEALRILGQGELEVLGRMPWSSNATFLAQADGHALCIYKPRKGERPLWDFPEGTLCSREVAAFVVSEALGWVIVPPTILRDGPHGEGMVQLFIDHDPEDHYLTLGESFPDRFRQFAAFDVVINNADRKSGHCLRAKADDHIWGIDHGVTFGIPHKLRTVIWDFAGEKMPATIRNDLARLDEDLRGALADTVGALLDDREVEALMARTERLVATGKFPQPRTDYPYPWPMV